MMTIALYGKTTDVALVDEEDYALLTERRWYLTPTGYVISPRPAPTMYMHRIVMGAAKGQEIDHWNGNPLDNRKQNLRFCTSAQNKHNRIFKGYTLDRRTQKWQVFIQRKYFGVYATEAEAAKVADGVKRTLYGVVRAREALWIGTGAGPQIELP
jgi:hypothetical protein